MAMIDAVSEAISRAEAAEERASKLDADLTAATAAQTSRDQAKVEEMAVVCDQWRARATGAEETTDALTTRVRQLESELADLLSVQKNSKLKLTWVPGAVIFFFFSSSSFLFSPLHYPTPSIVSKQH
jgi:hypothetical protein